MKYIIAFVAIIFIVALLWLQGNHDANSRGTTGDSLTTFMCDQPGSGCN